MFDFEGVYSKPNSKSVSSRTGNPHAIPNMEVLNKQAEQIATQIVSGLSAMTGLSVQYHDSIITGLKGMSGLSRSHDDTSINKSFEALLSPDKSSYAKLSKYSDLYTEQIRKLNDSLQALVMSKGTNEAIKTIGSSAREKQLSSDIVKTLEAINWSLSEYEKQKQAARSDVKKIEEYYHEMGELESRLGEYSQRLALLINALASKGGQLGGGQISKISGILGLMSTEQQATDRKILEIQAIKKTVDDQIVQNSVMDRLLQDMSSLSLTYNLMMLGLTRSDATRIESQIMNNQKYQQAADEKKLQAQESRRSFIEKLKNRGKKIVAGIGISAVVAGGYMGNVHYDKIKEDRIAVETQQVAEEKKYAVSKLISKPRHLITNQNDIYLISSELVHPAIVQIFDGPKEIRDFSQEETRAIVKQLIEMSKVYEFTSSDRYYILQKLKSFSRVSIGVSPSYEDKLKDDMVKLIGVEKDKVTDGEVNGVLASINSILEKSRDELISQNEAADLRAFILRSGDNLTSVQINYLLSKLAAHSKIAKN